eukprot:Sdes_comp21629_c0_seq1m20221
MSEPNQTSSEVEEIDAPLVFSCECKAIVGDSFAWISANQELNAITLKSVAPNVVITNSLETSTSGVDVGSTFIPFQCGECGKSLGKSYKTTARVLDELRDMFTFDLNSISCYKLGSSLQPSINEILCIPTALALQEQIIKVQNMILLLNERLETLEEHSTATTAAPFKEPHQNSQDSKENISEESLRLKKRVRPGKFL